LVISSCAVFDGYLCHIIFPADFFSWVIPITMPHPANKTRVLYTVSSEFPVAKKLLWKIVRQGQEEGG
jgi:hypothetical protein